MCKCLTAVVKFPAKKPALLFWNVQTVVTIGTDTCTLYVMENEELIRLSQYPLKTIKITYLLKKLIS